MSEGFTNLYLNVDIHTYIPANSPYNNRKRNNSKSVVILTTAKAAFGYLIFMPSI